MAEEAEAGPGEPGATDECAAEENGVVRVSCHGSAVLTIVAGVDDAFAYLGGK